MDLTDKEKKALKSYTDFINGKWCKGRTIEEVLGVFTLLVWAIIAVCCI